MKLLRQDLSRKDVRQRSELIAENLFAMPDFFRADVVHTYISSKNNEADTHEIIRFLLKEKKRVVVPIADKKNEQLLHSELFSLAELVGGEYGILVPRMYRPVPLHNLQAIIVPALAVDRTGNRIGFGAGFYDRFLKSVDIPTIVLVYDFQVMSTVPTESTDIPVSFIVTEKEIISTRNNSSSKP